MSYTPYGGGYGMAGSMPFGYPTFRPPTHGSSAINHLPSINSPQNNVLPQRARVDSGLQLSVKAMPNGPRIQATVPRERPVQYRRLSNSDSKALDCTRPPSQTLSRVKRNTTNNGVQLHSTVKSLPSQFHKPQKELDRVSPLYQPRPQSSLLKPILSHSLSRQPSSGKALPPIVSPTLTVELPISQKESADGSSDEDDDEDDSGSETSSDLTPFSEGSEAPPSRPGFESDAEQSGYFLNIPFPDVNQSISYPATLIQDHAQLDTDRFAAGTNTLGLSPRVDNIVRGFTIHGPLDLELLQKALNQVASLHPLLRASFQRTRDRLYIQTPVTGENAVININSPIIGHEQPQDLLINARRKIFQLEMKTNLVQSTMNESNYDNDIIVNAFSSTSVVVSDCSDKSKSPSIVRSHHKRVSFAPPSQTRNAPGMNIIINPSTYPQLPSIGQNTHVDDTVSLLVRAKLSSKGLHEHVLILSFPKIVCDFWSSCLFSHQLSNAYTKLEKTASYRPSLTASRIERKRQAVINAHEKMKNSSSTSRRDAASRLLQKRAHVSHQVKNEIYIPPFPSRLHFSQIAQRENQLLLMLSREKLWYFWESTVTAIIQRQRGPNRIKVVPPIRIPSGLGEKCSKTRPQTSKLRLLTASRNRPQTAKRELGLWGDVGMSREALAGPKTKFQYIKIEDHICTKFKQYLPEDYLSHILEEEVISLMCLGAYALMLGKCCRGWGTNEKMVRECGDRARGNLIQDSRIDFPTIASEKNKPQPQFPRDPLQKYKMPSLPRVPHPVVLTESRSPDAVFNLKRASITEKLDLGSFLIGMEISLRHIEPQKTQGVFGPLTNDGAIRVNLDHRETFSEFLLSLWKSILLARKHGHFPFPAIAEEVGLMHGLPIRFSYLYQRDIIQLTNPNVLYFPETAMGVEGQGLARFGSTCYLTPLNGKMDDNSHFELLLWESYDGDGVCGGIQYQPQVIKTELVESFSRELHRMLTVIAEDPCRLLVDLAQEIQPPFMNSGREKRCKTYRKSAAAGLP